MPLPPLIAVVGPTASGKTDAALEVARRFGGEIVLADSRQVYRGMDIGTNKAAGKWKVENGKRTYFVEDVPYHGVDLVEPNELFTAQMWKRYAQKTIEGILGRGRLPIIEGGTGLYVSALLENLAIPEVPPDAKLRAQLEKRLTREGIQAVVDEILKADPEAAAFLDTKNPRRIVRALEVIHATGIPFSTQRTRGPKLYDDVRIGIDPLPANLDRRIEERAGKQIDAGLEDEVRRLAKRYGWDIPAMTGIGYVEWRPRRSDRQRGVRPPFADVLEDIIRHTKQCARAQRKWFLRDASIRWVRSPDEAVAVAGTLLRQR